MILVIRTDKPESEIGLYSSGAQQDYEVWQAHRQLAETLHQKIKDLLQRNKIELSSIKGIVCYQGPGSFTGLRIGMSVANALAYGLQIPIVASTGDSWVEIGLQELTTTTTFKPVAPEYGAPVHITAAKR